MLPYFFLTLILRWWKREREAKGRTVNKKEPRIVKVEYSKWPTPRSGFWAKMKARKLSEKRETELKM